MARRLRSGFGLDSRTRCRWQRSFTVPLLFAVVVARADGGGDPSQFKDRVQALHDRVVELAGEDDLLDTLYFGWSDRPYARATLAILVKVAATLDCEVDRRGNGNGEIDDPTVSSMLQWADDAIQRVIHAEPSPDFRPDRMRITEEDLSTLSSIPPLYAFIDSASSTSHHPVFGGLDILAALGQRVHMRPIGGRGDNFPWRDFYQRANGLGMAIVRLPPDFGQGRPLSPSDTLPLWVVGLPTLRGAEEEAGTNLSWIPALWPVRTGESLASSLARRGMVGGVLARSTYAAYRWMPPILEARRENRLAALSAAMWVHALDGQRLAFLETWRDMGGADGAAGPSIFLDPFQAEKIAYTSLDLLRLGNFVHAFALHPILAFAVDRSAFARGDSEAREDIDPHEWAPWAERIWSAMLDRQVAFDVGKKEAPCDELQRRYRIVIPLERPAGGEMASLIAKSERRLAQDSEHVYRLTAREMDGTIARDMFVRVGRTPEGKACAGIVNLSDRSRVLKLRGKPAIGPSRDVISNQEISEPDQRLELEPWQVRLLWPTA